ncbi:hypothetical protein EAH72_14955 [Pseudomonas caspiana]|nr:hypothetical protein EAH72_14955 [Pseudomonas caspiana]
MAREFNSLAPNRGAAFASRLAPTLDLCRTQNVQSPKIPCGSEPAREAFKRFSGQQTHPPFGPVHRAVTHRPAQHWHAAINAGTDQLAL